MAFLAEENNLGFGAELRTIKSLRGQLLRKEIWSVK